MNSNQFIFNEIIIYLIHGNNINNNKNKIKTIIEYSFISKSTFKAIKNYLCSYDCNRFQFILSFGCFIKHLKQVNIISIFGVDNYTNQLIQYKDIEIIRFERIDDYLEYPKKSKELKQLFNDTCIKLKHVMVDIDFYNPNVKHDHSHDGFFKLNHLAMIWNGHINDGLKKILTKDEIGNGYTQDVFKNMYGYYDIEPLFTGLVNYSPNKISINTNSRGRIVVEKLNNILKICGSTKVSSYKFNYHTTPFSFIEMILNQQNPNIKSLSIIVDRYFINGRDKHKDIFEPCKLITQLLISNGIQNNTTLVKLKINDHDDSSRSSSSDPSKLLQYLSLNKTITALDLGCFQIRDHKLLSPLKIIKNIKTLYCDGHSLSSFLFHCIENSNIKVLHFTDGLFTDPDPIVKQFQTFLTSGTSSLQTIKIWSHSQKLKDNLIELFSNLNLNKTINIKFTNNGKLV